MCICMDMHIDIYIYIYIYVHPYMSSKEANRIVMQLDTPHSPSPLTHTPTHSPQSPKPSCHLYALVLIDDTRG